MHDGRWHDRAQFHHTLYAQASRTPPGWAPSMHAMQDPLWNIPYELVAPQGGQRALLFGERVNEDVWIDD